MPNALITGITGQDGSYLAEFLLSKGYTVYGLVRRTSMVNKQRMGSLCLLRVWFFLIAGREVAGE